MAGPSPRDTEKPLIHHVFSMTQEGFHPITYSEWLGHEGATTLICAHGLTRNRRDFNALGKKLAPEYRVCALDFSGRGDSGRLKEGTGYTFQQYETDALVVLAHVLGNEAGRNLAPLLQENAQTCTTTPPLDTDADETPMQAALPTEGRANPQKASKVRRVLSQCSGFISLVFKGLRARHKAKLARELTPAAAIDAPHTPLAWLGTSMGGMVGMMLAARENSPIQALILNDVGPLIPWSGIARLGRHSSPPLRFKDRAEGEAWVRHVCAAFGITKESHWAQMFDASLEQDSLGFWRARYDPAIAAGLAQGAGLWQRTGWRISQGFDLWHLWDRIQCPVLVLRGAQSDILTPSTVSRMQQKGPQIEVVEFDGVGHAPALLDPAQIRVVDQFLTRVFKPKTP